MKIRRVNLDLQKKHCSDASGTNKKNDYKEISSKRLKYCYQKKQKIPNAEITISHQFNDHQYFSVPKTSVNMTAISNTSNLLTKSHMKSAHNSQQKRKKEILVDPELKNYKEQYDFKNDSPTIREVNYINFPSNKHLKSHTFRERMEEDYDQEGERPKSVRKSIKINPYTNQQYLYYRKKQKQKYKKTLDDLRKKQQLLSILKPCQIYQKQIKIRQGKPQTQKYSPKKQFFRSRTANPSKRADFGLQPWEVTNNINHQDFL